MKHNITYWENGNKRTEYFLNDKGEFHNENGPAIIYFYENGNKEHEDYYINNSLHNKNGPAFISYLETGEINDKQYWINDEFINVDSDKEFQRYLKLNNIS